MVLRQYFPAPPEDRPWAHPNASRRTNRRETRRYCSRRSDVGGGKKPHVSHRRGRVLVRIDLACCRTRGEGRPANAVVQATRRQHRPLPTIICVCHARRVSRPVAPGHLHGQSRLARPQGRVARFEPCRHPNPAWCGRRTSCATCVSFLRARFVLVLTPLRGDLVVQKYRSGTRTLSPGMIMIAWPSRSTVISPCAPARRR
jgi:hypothetical protein